MLGLTKGFWIYKLEGSNTVRLYTTETDAFDSYISAYWFDRKTNILIYEIEDHLIEYSYFKHSVVLLRWSLSPYVSDMVLNDHQACAIYDGNVESFLFKTRDEDSYLMMKPRGIVP